VETFFGAEDSLGTAAPKQRSSNASKPLLISFLLGFLPCSTPVFAQAPKSNAGPVPSSALTADKAIVLAEQGHCKEALPTLKRTMNGQESAETRKKAGIVGIRCSLTVDNHDSALDFIRALGKQFPEDPDVLFILVHAYSDLSSKTALELGRDAPQSIPARKLNAEALEMQGKWDEAQHEYESMIEKEPHSPGLHFLLGRLLLSRPDADAKATDRAREEFRKEIAIDPKNAAAHYVLGELARRNEDWEQAIAQFSQAAALDSNFAEAYFGWGFSLVTIKRYQEAIAPLRVAERLTPGNPSIHYSLATALIRTGQKEEAEKEFAIHRTLTATKPGVPSEQKP
jgi:tetratricopeptide (TPR) repeat protein